MKRGFLSLLCAAALTLGLAGTALAADFVDVQPGAWYYDDVQAVAQEGLMNGTSATAFSPSASVTRATVLAVLWRLEDSPQPQAAAAFPDVPAESWYAGAAAWAQEAGIAAGYSNGNLGPDDTVTREQLAMFLYRYAQYKQDVIAEGVLDLYADGGKVSKWAVPGMKHALGLGLMTGDGKGNLDPLGVASRAELAVILGRLMTPAAG